MLIILLSDVLNVVGGELLSYAFQVELQTKTVFITLWEFITLGFAKYM